MNKQENTLYDSNPSENNIHNSFVCFIDIMGFKEMVARKKSQEIYDSMKKLRESIFDMKNILKNGDLKVITFSDSIIIYSKDDTNDGFNQFLYYVSGFLNDLFIYKIPFRGSIAYGKMVVDFENSIFFGQPQIDAYLLSEELQFYGIVFHSSAEKKLIELYKSSNDRVNIVQNYQCKFKCGDASHLTIIPFLLVREVNGKKCEKRDINFKEYYALLNEFKLETSGHIRKYIEYTESYLKFIYDNEDLDWDNFIDSFNSKLYIKSLNKKL